MCTMTPQKIKKWPFPYNEIPELKGPSYHIYDHEIIGEGIEEKNIMGALTLFKHLIAAWWLGSTTNWIIIIKNLRKVGWMVENKMKS